ncbi:MAG: hypothetical protein GVX96_03525 [Bacteroidetes bacterium]|jgi:hypothetical protein|nr:hypothetical protein [Bacteroidota bacterium]
MRIIFIATFLFGVFASCAQQNSEEDSSKPISNAESKKSETITTEVEDRDPVIDMILVEEFHPTENWSAYSAYIQGRDAKYYHVDGGYGYDVSVELAGGHPAIQLMVMDINDEMVLRENLNGKTLRWTDTYEESGRYTFIVSLDSKFDGKEQVRTPFDIRFTLEP